MIVLAPRWPGMPWFWDLVDLSTRVSLQLPHWKTLLTFQQVPQQRGVPESTCVASGFQESNSGRFSSEVAEKIKAPQRESSRKVKVAIYGQWCSQNKVDSNCSPGSRVSKLPVHSEKSQTSHNYWLQNSNY